jgi:hypothetical protein
VSTILAHCGPCACNRGEHCLMARFDRRDPDVDPESEPVKPTKAPARKKKAGPQISPLNTHAVNSRSGSEVRKADADDEPTDSRSTSGSAERGSASRDITPNTHYSANGTAEMSERERRKLAKVEELFSKQDEQASSKKDKKKRSSAGSALNTPGATTSKQLGLPPTSSSRYADSGTTRQSGLPSAKPSSGKRPKPVTTSSGTSKTSTKRSRTPKPVYTDSSVQCDMSDEEAARQAEPPRVRRPFVPLQQLMLQRCARNNVLNRQYRLSIRSKSEENASKMDLDASASEKPDPVSPSPNPAPEPAELEAEPSHRSMPPNDKDGDVEMDDSPVEDSTATVIVAGPPSPTKELAAPSSPRDSHLPPDPSADQRSSEEPESDQGPPPDEAHDMPPADASKSPEMRMSMPPPPTNPFAAAPQSSNGATTGSTIVQSPATIGPGGASGPVFSPSVNAAVASGPTRKKLSLSDYTRRKKEQPSDSKPDRESSPASVTSGPTSAAVVPSLQASASEVKNAQESGSAVVDDDVKMDDAAPSSSS